MSDILDRLAESEARVIGADTLTRLEMFLAAVGASTPDDHPWVVESRALADKVASARRALAPGEPPRSALAASEPEREPNPYCGPDCRCGPEADAYACEGEPRSVETVRQETSLDDVMRYFAQGYELGSGELLDVKYAITSEHPRRVWFQLTVRYEDAPADDQEVGDE